MPVSGGMATALAAVVLGVFAVNAFAQEAAQKKAAPRYLPLIRSHYDHVIAFGTDRYGKDKNGLWLACIDIKNGGLPEREYPAVKRAYREITSPNGSNLYWEQPAVVAAYHVSGQTGDPKYGASANLYLRDFLARCVSDANGLFYWGNHYFYNVLTDENYGFSGSQHEARPFPCAWEMLWTASPEATEREIRAMGTFHVKDKQTGFFDRHASPALKAQPRVEEKNGEGIDPFLEVGGVLVESLCWLSAKKNGDAQLEDLARRVARYSYDKRDPRTGLIRNQPRLKRWDYYASTTEIGLWAGCLLRAADLARDTALREEFREMARTSIAAWLRYGWDPEAERYRGKLRVADGKPAPPADTEYAPGEYADLWGPLFPTHNYPMPLAEACLTLYRQTNDPVFKEAAQRWARIVERSLPANNGKGAYADQYGRCIHFLLRASAELKDAHLKTVARRLAGEAVARLYDREAGMFRGHPGEDRCDAVDGVGILFLSLLYLDNGAAPDPMGFHF